VDKLAGKRAKLLRQPRHPARFHQIAGLPERHLTAGRAALHQARMPPVFARQQRNDSAALPVRARFQDDRRGLPLHGG